MGTAITIGSTVYNRRMDYSLGDGLEPPVGSVGGDGAEPRGNGTGRATDVMAWAWIGTTTQAAVAEPKK